MDSILRISKAYVIFLKEQIKINCGAITSCPQLREDDQKVTKHTSNLIHRKRNKIRQEGHDEGRERIRH